jgi:hypothetical protein
VLIIIVLLQSAIFYLQASLGGLAIDPLRFANAISLVVLTLFFYLTLVIMLGAVFDSRRPVIAVSLGVLLGQLMFSDLILNWIPWFLWIEPNTLIMLADQYFQGLPLPDEWRYPVLATATMSIAFTVLAIWRFKRDEF